MKSKIFKNKILVLLITLFSSEICARETMTRLGYQSCVACHQSSRGGNLLTPYGKLIATSLPLKKGDPSKISHNAQFEQNLKFRLANVNTDISNDTFPMQADYIAAFNTPKYKVISILAKSPNRNEQVLDADKPSTIETIYFRELKYIYQGKDLLLSIGREHQNLGLFLEDHTTYVKSENSFNITDLTSMISVYRNKKKLQFSASIFAPNFQEKEGSREHGIKSQFKYQVASLGIGAGALIGKSDDIQRELISLNFKFKINKQLILMSESNYTRRENTQSIKFTQQAHYLKLSFFPIEAMETFFTSELIRREAPFLLSEEKIGIGTQLQMTSNLSARMDYKKSFLSQREEDVLVSQLYLNWW